MSKTHQDVDISIGGQVPSLFDPSQDQFSGWNFDDANGSPPLGLDTANGFDSGLALTAAGFSGLDLSSPLMAPAFHFDMFDGASADAKGGGGGGKPGGGGGKPGGGGDLLTTYTSGNGVIDDDLEYNIQINFSGSWTAQQQAIVTWAADLLSTIVTGDLEPDTVNGVAIDDIVISMSAGRIDGTGNLAFGNVLAQTSLGYVRDDGTTDEWLPLTASIKLDSTDLKNSVSNGWFGTWDDIVLHEMVHALGFAGYIFDKLGLVDPDGNFIGVNAMSVYGGLPPLEDGGGSGTAGSHWDESDFALNGVQMSNELMTGYVGLNEQTWLSDVTVAALADLGYVVIDPSTGSYLPIDLLA